MLLFIRQHVKGVSGLNPSFFVTHLRAFCLEGSSCGAGESRTVRWWIQTPHGLEPVISH